MTRRQDGPPRQRRVFDALGAAFTDEAPTVPPAPVAGDPPSAAACAYLADRLRAVVELLDHLPPADCAAAERALRSAIHLAEAAARHGYPRPALEHLAHEADRLPSARTADPVTSKDARPRLPTRGNHLGRLLVGFAMYERNVDSLGAGDRTLTSEELAHRVGLGGAEYAKRCSDLLALGYIRVARDDDGHERTRRGDAGRQRLVFELTDDGRAVAQRLGKSAG